MGSRVYTYYSSFERALRTESNDAKIKSIGQDLTKL